MLQSRFFLNILLILASVSFANAGPLPRQDTLTHKRYDCVDDTSFWDGSDGTKWYTSKCGTGTKCQSISDNQGSPCVAITGSSEYFGRKYQTKADRYLSAGSISADGDAGSSSAQVASLAATTVSSGTASTVSGATIVGSAVSSGTTSIALDLTNKQVQNDDSDVDCEEEDSDAIQTTYAEITVATTMTSGSASSTVQSTDAFVAASTAATVAATSLAKIENKAVNIPPQTSSAAATNSASSEDTGGSVIGKGAGTVLGDPDGDDWRDAGDTTLYYAGGGSGQCGVALPESEYWVALSQLKIDALPGAIVQRKRNTNNNPYCLAHATITIKYKDVTIPNVPVKDRCTACAVNDIDLSTKLFTDLFAKDITDPVAVGRIPGKDHPELGHAQWKWDVLTSEPSPPVV